MPFSREEIEAEFNELQPDPTIFLLVEQSRRAAKNREYVAAWRARQSKATLKKLRRAEYLRNRARRLETSKAYRARSRLRT